MTNVILWAAVHFGVNLGMESLLVGFGPTREATLDHLPCRVGLGTDLDQQSGYGPNHNPQEQGPAAKRVGLAIQHMVRHLNEPLRVSTLATMSGLSPSHFFSLFKSATGFTPIAFFIRLRMHRACELLKNTKSSIKEAAELVGYGDRYYFSRLFKQVIGIPPGEYRRTSFGSSAKTPEGASSNVKTSSAPNPSLPGGCQ